MKRSRLMAAVVLATAALLLAACNDVGDPKPYIGGGIPGTGKHNTDGSAKDAPAADAAGADATAADSSAPDSGAPDSAAPDAGGTSCTVDCDCPQGLRCTTGKCTRELQPVYCCNRPGCVATKLCTDFAGNPGVCGTTGFCVDQCDCEQGLTCTSSLCTITATPSFCCAKAGCPTGQACINLDGSSGTCP